MHHNKSAMLKQPRVLSQTTVCRMGDGQLLELNRHDRRHLKIRGEHVLAKTVFKEKRDL
jgi:hypothetical protein